MAGDVCNSDVLCTLINARTAQAVSKGWMQGPSYSKHKFFSGDLHNCEDCYSLLMY